MVTITDPEVEYFFLHPDGNMLFAVGSWVDSHKHLSILFSNDCS